MSLFLSCAVGFNLVSTPHSLCILLPVSVSKTCESDRASVGFGFGHYVARKVDLSPMHVFTRCV